MKKLFLSALMGCAFCSVSLFAQGQFEIEKTYYDSLTRKKVKEIFHVEQVIKVIPDKKHHGEYLDTMYTVKSGPYTYYYENGNTQVTGYYTNEKKDSIWQYYDPKGKLVKTERYRVGQLVK